MKYVKAKAEVVMFDNNDIITTSGGVCVKPDKPSKPGKPVGGIKLPICRN